MLRSLRASRTRDVVCELRGSISATSTLLGLTRLAQAFHEHASVELVSSVLVVGAAHETDSARVMNVLPVYPNGVISFRTVQWYISGCLDSELIGLEQVDDDRWKVHFGPIVLGMIDLRRASERGSCQFATLVRFDGEITDPRMRRRRPPYRR